MSSQRLTISAREQMRRMWSIFPTDLHQPIALRAISPRGSTPKLHPINVTFTAAAYRDVEARRRAFEAEAIRLNHLGYNVYIVMNPVRLDFGSEGADAAAVCDADIACRSVLLIDLDRAHGAADPATDSEIRAAGCVARKVADFLELLGWPPPARVMSGNGYHLYYALSRWPNDALSRLLVHTLLRRLGEKFNVADVRIDPAVANASRVTKVPGTVARKGAQSEQRPFRRAVVIDPRPPAVITQNDVERAIVTLSGSSRLPLQLPRHLGANGIYREPDTPRRRAQLRAMLAHISADCGYGDYRDIVWAILSSGWPDAETIAREWCVTARARYDATSFATIVRSYDPARDAKHSFGTIRHQACAGGWHG